MVTHVANDLAVAQAHDARGVLGELAEAASGGAKPSDDAKKEGTAKAVAGKSVGKVGETKECVFVVEEAKARLRVVKSGIGDETSVAILEGLKDGETVVTGPYRGLRDLKNGDAVKEKKAQDANDKGGAKAEVKVE